RLLTPDFFRWPPPSAVLYMDTLVCEDSSRHQLPLLRVPADFEKFFNTLQLPLIDAMQQGRGFPDAVRRLHQALFAPARVCLDTRVGLTSPLPVTRGLPQGA
ncbi:psaE, partial [Symbiodinium sp. CCMP2456]